MLYCSTDQLADLLGADPADPRLLVAVTAAGAVVEHYYGQVTVAARLRDVDFPDELVDPVPDVVQLAALTIAGDLWRRPDTPGGYFQVADYVGRLAKDPAAPVTALLDAIPGGRERWAIG